jgi:hypothetical protein
VAWVTGERRQEGGFAQLDLVRGRAAGPASAGDGLG